MSSEKLKLNRYMSPFRSKPAGGISSAALKIIAVLLMLADHIWASGVSDAQWLNYIGRLAFPIFAFQITEGFLHTSDRKRYAKRLLVFGVISEIPFNLVINSSIFFPYYQNVMFTLLLGLICITWIEKLKQERTFYAAARCSLVLLGCCLLATLGFTDYGVIGVLTVVAFYLFRGFPFAWVGQLLAMTVLHIICFWELGTPLEVFIYNTSFGNNVLFSFPCQGLAVLALPVIWLYNGKKGYNGKLLQYFTYIFYPAHLLILYVISVITL